MADLEAMAEASAVLRQVRALAEWVGAGRKLTPSGNLTLADARHLVNLLATGDEMDPEIGGRTWRTRSSEDLPRLNAIVIWAKTVRLLRVYGGRLVPLKTNASLLGRPLDLWRTLFDVFDDLVDAVCPPGYLPSLLAEDFPRGVWMFFHELASRGGVIGTTEAVEAVSDGLSVRFRVDPSGDWSATRHDIQNMITALVALGVLREEAPGTVRMTELAEWALRRPYGVTARGETVAQLKITLEHVEPPIWRRVIVPAKSSLGCLHDVIQAAMGWQDNHLHMFVHGERRYGIPDPDLPLIYDRAIPVDHVLRVEGDIVEYEYDFGDSWDHRVELEELMPAAPDVTYPVFVDGERACPPEDCGGTPGYQDLLKARVRQDSFDPERFDVEEAKARFEVTVRRPATY
jgi:hypothetical protein